MRIIFRVGDLKYPCDVAYTLETTFSELIKQFSVTIDDRVVIHSEDTGAFYLPTHLLKNALIPDAEQLAFSIRDGNFRFGTLLF